MKLKISDIRPGMKNFQVTGKIINMNNFMLVINDGSGQTFVRYSQRNLTDAIKIGDYIVIKNCRAVKYTGILQLILHRNSKIALQSENDSPI